MKFEDLRPHQQKAISMLRAGWKQHKTHLINSPCGSGKTALASYLCQAFADKGKKVVFTAPYQALVNQTYERFEQYGHDDLSVIWRHDARYRKNCRVQIASSDTLIRREFPEDAEVLIVDECFSGDTEVLTDEGFVRFDLLGDQVVAQYHIDSEHLTFTNEYKKIIKPATEGILKIQTEKNFDLMVTPKHDMIVDGVKIKADMIGGRLRHKGKMKTAALAQGDECGIADFERFLIAFQADGRIHRNNKNGTQIISFAFSKHRKIERIIEIIEKCGFNYKHLETRRAKGNIKSVNVYMVYLPFQITKDIRSFFDLKRMSLERSRLIIEEMNHWDGHVVRDRGSYLWTNTCKLMADFYQAVAVMSGYATNLCEVIDKRKNSYKKIYRLFIRKDCRDVGLQQWRTEKIEYSGLVYCVSVPSGAIVVRRNGKVLVVGNCDLKRKALLEIMDRDGLHTIGLTATPFAKWLGSHYQNFIKPITARELIELELLTPFDIYSPEPPKIEKGLKLKKNEFGELDIPEDYAARVMGDAKIVGKVLDNWIQNGDNEPTIAFAPNVATANAYCLEFQRAGIHAEVMTADTPMQERGPIFYRYNTGRTKVIWNVGVLGAGFDADVRNIIWCRMTKSERVYVQGVMRGSRPAPGKRMARLFDHAGTYWSLGDPCDIEYYELHDGTEEEDKKRQQKKEKTEKEAKQKICKACGHVKAPGEFICSRCGYKPLAGEITVEVDESRGLESVDGKAKKEKQLTTEQKRQLYSELRYYALEHGKKDGWVAHKFRNKTGVWPNHYKDAIPVPPSTETLNFIKHEQIKFAKSRARA